MGVFVRKDSPFYWLFLERGPGEKGIKERTQILHNPPTTWQRRENKRRAEERYHHRMAQLARGDVAPGVKPTTTFCAFATWFREHKLPQRRGRERDAGILDRLVRVFGPYPLVAITRKLVAEKWITPRLTTPTVVAKKKLTAARSIQAGPSTVNREVDFLKAVLSAGVPEYFEQSPLYGMKRLTTATPKRRLLKEEEEGRLLAALAPDDRALFLIGSDALVRLTDILDLKWSDDHGDRLWIADPKAGGGFEVPLSTRARKALDAMPRAAGDYIFGRRRVAATERDRRAVIRKMLARACAVCDPPIPYGRTHGGITFHWATRRTGATRMLTRKIDIGTVQKVGRWKSAEIVLGIYHDLIDEEARRAVESVGPAAGTEREQDPVKPGKQRIQPERRHRRKRA